MQLASAASLAGSAFPAFSSKAKPPQAGKVGVYISLKDPESTMQVVRDLGCGVCEIYTEDLDLSRAEKLAASARLNSVQVVALITLGPGKTVWNFHDGPGTIGIVPREHRRVRMEHLKRASEFARKAGIPAVETHVGFIPEEPRDPLFEETVQALKEVAGYCRGNGQQFLYHAGQETAITLLRTIEEVGLDNQRVGLDTANPVLYGKGNPVDSVEILGKHLGLVNYKDGLWPVNGKDLGREVPIPQGKVDFPRLVGKLREVGYAGPMVIEHETSGPQWEAEVRAAKGYIEGLLNTDPQRRSGAPL